MTKKTIILCLFFGIWAGNDQPDLSFLSQPEKFSGEHKQKVSEILKIMQSEIQDLTNNSSISTRLMRAKEKTLNQQLTTTNLENKLLINQVTDLNKEVKKFEGVWGKTKGPIKLCLSVTALVGAGYAIYYIFIKKTSSSRTPTDIREEEFRKKIISNELQRQVNSIEIQENTLKIQRQQLAAKTSPPASEANTTNNSTQTTDTKATTTKNSTQTTDTKAATTKNPTQKTDTNILG